MRAIQITAPHFVAAVIVGIAAAPIVGYMRPWSHDRIVRYCRRKRWRVEEVEIRCEYI